MFISAAMSGSSFVAVCSSIRHSSDTAMLTAMLRCSISLSTSGKFLLFLCFLYLSTLSSWLCLEYPPDTFLYNFCTLCCTRIFVFWVASAATFLLLTGGSLFASRNERLVVRVHFKVSSVHISLEAFQSEDNSQHSLLYVRIVALGCCQCYRRVLDRLFL